MSKNPSDRVEFTRAMRKNYTILIPMMAETHFALIQKAMESTGLKIELLHNKSHQVVEEGLKYVHNDTCYPALLVIGQFIDALNSGKYDLDHTAVMLTQTGGGCRASNYIQLMRKAFKKAGYGQVPIISMNMSGLEKNSGFHLTISLIRKFLSGVVYGDLLMLLKNQVKPYEITPGETDALVETWVEKLSALYEKNRGYGKNCMIRNLNLISDDFAKIKVDRTRKKIRVGIVGEIYVKYSALGNNSLQEFLEDEGCEVNVPGLMGFSFFKVDNRLEDIKLYGGSLAKKKVVTILYNYLTLLEKAINDAVKRHPEFYCPSDYVHTKSLVDGVIGYGDKMGEGWLLTAEMIELTVGGFENIVCAQPFGCLPNHVCGKGMISKIRALYPTANIVPIDYDPSATRVNQENRIKLMLAVAKERLQNEENSDKIDTKEKEAVTL